MDYQVEWSRLTGFPFEKLGVFLAILSTMPSLSRLVQGYEVLHRAAPNWFFLVPMLLHHDIRL